MPSFLDRMLLLPTALLGLSVSHALAHSIGARDDSRTIPAPLSFTPDENWDGVDGSWSTFTVGIGTPPQYVRTFASWASYQTWAVLPSGCFGAADENDCRESRGWFFDNSTSSTWQEVGIYELLLEQNLGFDTNAQYGYDKIMLGAPGDNGPVVENSTVGAFASTQYYLGIFGVNPKPTNFTSFNDGSPSYMTQLKEQKSIPSISFGYTAGAHYKGATGELASLTLGGYDSSKFVGNDVEFTFASDNSRDTVVAVQSISTPAQDDSNPVGTELLPGPVYAYLDATIAEIWLPVESCKIFESVFGLEYDSTTELYLVNNTLHQKLLNQDPTITFKLAQDLTGGASVDIELPYSAFDLTAQPPYQYLSSESLYFPLRRAANETQYTIGRTFFQEAYISVNYETQKFNVSQRDWSGAEMNLVSIPPGSDTDVSGANRYPGTETSTDSDSSGGISTGAIAGAAVGAAAVLILLGLGLFFYLRRRRNSPGKAAKHEKLESDSDSTNNTRFASPSNGRQENVFPKAELAGSSPENATAAGSEDGQLLSAGGNGASSGSGTMTPRSPNFLSGSTWMSRGNRSDSPSTPHEGEGTHSSTSTSNGNGTMQSAVSPATDSRSESDSKERPAIYEMIGDMPKVEEKDGRQYSEKEALAHRERVYNGVDSAPTSAFPSETSDQSREPTRRIVNPAEVERSDTAITNEWPLAEREFTRHRAFSFEGVPSSNEGTQSSQYSQPSQPSSGAVPSYLASHIHAHGGESQEDLYSSN